MGPMTSDLSPFLKLESLSFPIEDPGDLCTDPLEKVVSFSPSAKGLQCPAPRAPAFPTAAATSGTNETRSREAAPEALTRGFPSAVPLPRMYFRRLFPNSLTQLEFLGRACLSCSRGNADLQERAGGWFVLVLVVCVRDPRHYGRNRGYFPLAGEPETPITGFFTPYLTPSLPSKVIAPMCYHSDYWIGADSLPWLPQ